MAGPLLGVYLALCLSNAAEAVEVLSAGYILVQLTDVPRERTMIALSVFGGMLVGGLLSGQLADRIGRSTALRVAMLLATCAMLFAAAAPNLTSLMACRACSGFGVGAATPALFALAVELAPRGRSGQAVTLVASFWMVGSLAVASLAYVFMRPQLDGANVDLDLPSMSWSAPWRRFAIACAALPTAATILVFACVKDAPRWNSVAQDTAAEKQHAACTVLLDRLAAQRRALLALMLTWFGLSFGYYGLATWVTLLLRQSGIHDEYAVAILYAAATLPGSVASFALIDRLGRRWLLIGSMALSAAASLGLAVVELVRRPGTSPNNAAVVGLALAFNACATAGWNALDAISAEAFDVDVRATTLGILTSTGRVAAVAAQVVNGSLTAHVPALLILTGSFMAIGCISALLSDVKDVRAKRNVVLVQSPSSLIHPLLPEQLGVVHGVMVHE